MRTVLLAIPFLVVVALVVHAEGSFDRLTVWNCFPLAAGFAAFLIGLRARGAIAAACVTFAVSASLLTALFHLAWHFDSEHGRGSSTSALALIFMPVWSLIIAGVIAVAALVVSRLFSAALRPLSMRQR